MRRSIIMRQDFGSISGSPYSQYGTSMHSNSRDAVIFLIMNACARNKRRERITTNDR